MKIEAETPFPVDQSGSTWQWQTLPQICSTPADPQSLQPEREFKGKWIAAGYFGKLSLATPWEPPTSESTESSSHDRSRDRMHEARAPFFSPHCYWRRLYQHSRHLKSGWRQTTDLDVETVQCLDHR
jgi:hypothetical protein